MMVAARASCSVLCNSSTRICHRSRQPVSCLALFSASPDHKRAAAACFVKTYVRSNTVLGLGSGEMVNLAIQQVGLQLASGQLTNVVGVPACDAAAHEAAFHGLPLTTLEHAQVDVAFDQVDQLDVAANAAISGARPQPSQPHLTRTREVATHAARFVVLADSADVVSRLGGVLPVMVEAEEWEDPVDQLDDLFLGDAELWRRAAEGVEHDPRGGDNPYSSPEGHFIIDIRFDGSMKLFGEDRPYSEVVAEIEGIPGVVTHGLLLGMATSAIIARKGGEPEVVELKR